MDCELFQVSAVKAFGHCRDIKAMVSDMQQVLSAVPGMVRKNERLDRENAELRQENAALKVELDDWKGNAEGFEPDAYMRLPLDADGVPIRIGDTVWYVGGDLEIEKSEPQKVEGLVSVFAADGIYVMTRDYPDKATRPKMLTHKQPEPPDSWEKLKEDAMKGSCTYFGKIKDINTVCSKCPHGKKTGIDCWQNMNLDLVRRAKRLAGIEEQEGGERTAIADKKGER